MGTNNFDQLREELVTYSNRPGLAFQRKSAAHKAVQRIDELIPLLDSNAPKVEKLSKLNDLMQFVGESEINNPENTDP